MRTAGRWVRVLSVVVGLVVALCSAALADAQVAVAPRVAQGQTTEHGVIRDPSFDPLPGATADFGFYTGGSYRIEIPSDWNGALVLFAHGYRGEGPDIFVSNSPIREHLIALGYAWAASSYRGNSFRSDWGVDDTLALHDLFIERYGSPRWTILHGQSMGGHVLVASLEQHPGAYQAALAECAVLMGIEEYDYLAAYTAAADYISGVRLLDAPSQATFSDRVKEAVQALGTPGAYTERGKRFDSVVKYLTGGDLPFRERGLAQRYTENLVRLPDPASAPVSAPALRAFSTRNIEFQVDPDVGLAAAELNAGVRRYDHAPGARSAADNAVFADVTGRISVPVMTLHGTGDAFVPFRFEKEYRQLAVSAGTGDLLVQRAIRRPGHCAFSAAEREATFDNLVTWLEDGVRPDGDDVLSRDPAHLGQAFTLPFEPDDPLRQ